MMGFWDAVASAGQYANNLHLDPEITIPTAHHSIFTGRMLFLLPNQQCQSTDSSCITSVLYKKDTNARKPASDSRTNQSKVTTSGI